MGVYGAPSADECGSRWKLSQPHYLRQSKALPSPIKIAVSLQILFEDAYRKIMGSCAYEFEIIPKLKLNNVRHINT
uniref:Uncharacterized protein n=1 Tax=Glossina palpalis gambiensis TaxID=67801 RepID=A0A1B0B8W8_9MUSC